MALLVYSPGVRVHIETIREGIIDVTDDLASGSMTLRENNSSGFQFVVMNNRRKYDGIFTPNDRIVVQMKRIGPFIQVFAGYLDQVPYFTVYPRSVQLMASCSLKRLRFRFWDAGTQESWNLLHQEAQGNPNDVDGGLKKQVMSLLVQVADWPSEQIHIGAIPGQWFDKVEALRNQILPKIQQDQASLGSGSTVAGSGTSATYSTNPTPDGKGTGTLPAQSGLASNFAGPGNTDATGHFALTGESGLSPLDPWYCAMRWPYAVNQPITPTTSRGPIPNPQMTAAERQHCLDWWRNRKILVVNPKNNKACVVRAADWGPGAEKYAIDLSPHANKDVLGLGGSGAVNISFADPSLPLGPVNLTDAQNAGGAPTATAPGISSAAAKYASSDPVTASNPVAATTAPTSGKPTSTDFLRLALSKKGDSYTYGAPPPAATDPNPTNFDCSSFVQWAASRVGINLPRTSGGQFNVCQPIPIDQAFTTPGALLFVGDKGSEHVAISVGDGVHTIEAANHVFGVGQLGVQGRGWSSAGLIPGMSYEGVVVGGSIDGAPNGNLINTFNWVGQPDVTSNILAGPRAMLNDDPILTTADVLMKASMRSYMAAPNGDFIGWFPDYFGIYGTAGKMKIEPIEMAGDGFALVWNDQQLITHQFTAGAMTGFSTGELPGEATDVIKEYMTTGIVSVEFPEVLAALINVDPNDPAGAAFASPDAILSRFGARPNFSPMQYISNPQAEFWYAVYLFQQTWASQFSARVDLTWMPELYPGMLLVLEAYGFQAYITSVTHTFDFAGGGFNTSVSIVAPSTTGGTSGLYGLAKGGVA